MGGWQAKTFFSLHNPPQGQSILFLFQPWNWKNMTDKFKMFMLRINNEKKLWYNWNAHWWPILRCCYLVPDTILHWKNGRTDFGQTNIFFINKKHISKEGMACSKLIKISRLKMDNRAVRTLSKVNSSKYHLQLQFLVWHFQLEQDFQEFCDTTKIILHFFFTKVLHVDWFKFWENN